MNTLSALVFFAAFCFLIIILIIIIAIPAVPSIVIYKLVRRKFGRRAALICTSIIPLFCIYEIHTAIWPGDDFYKSEFKNIVNIDFPNSGKFIRKDASYPDIHGDYCLCALIEFSEKDYQNLLAYVKSDTAFNDDDIWAFGDQLRKVLGPISFNQIIYKASYYMEDSQGSIAFINDAKTVIIGRCKI
jgi:hypothetical protein